jgi:lipopolysaccharide export system permease protein
LPLWKSLTAVSMRTARRYLANEIYRSSTVVLFALLGLFTFFALVDDLDNVGSKFTIWALLYLQALALPTRMYDLLPIGLLIGSILALAGLAQRNELVILRVSGVSGMRLLGILWIITIPVVIGATVLSEWITPMAEIKSSEANLLFRGRAGGGRLESGYWFKEPARGGGMRIINIQTLKADGEVEDITLYEFRKDLEMSALSKAQSGTFTDGNLILKNVVENRLSDNAADALANAQAATPTLEVVKLATRVIPTTLTRERLLARVLTPERMSLAELLDYIDYLDHNHLQADRQIVAVWRKIIYPFTLLIMMTIAAPVAFMQTRRGGVGAKVFIGILLGVGYFMVNQLSLNVGMLSRWPPWVTAVLPNLGVLLLALGALTMMEYRHAFSNATRQRWPWSRSPV